MEAQLEQLQLRVFGDAALPALVYLPGLHGDWTIVTSFRLALKERARFVEITYPRTLTWTMQDYADAIETALLSRGIHRGWLLGESFGSQPAWALMGNNLSPADARAGDQAAPRFQAEGLILAAGFVKHPSKHAPGILRWIGQRKPMWLYRILLGSFRVYVRLRHCHTPETLADLNEFVSRRTSFDREAMRHRLALLDQYDPRPVARQTRVPVYYLAGLVDPLVPWPWVRYWLRKNCPGYRGGHTVWFSGHTVLATAPARAADLVLKWMPGPEGSPRPQAPA